MGIYNEAHPNVCYDVTHNFTSKVKFLDLVWNYAKYGNSDTHLHIPLLEVPFLLVYG